VSRRGERGRGRWAGALGAVYGGEGPGTSYRGEDWGPLSLLALPPGSILNRGRMREPKLALPKLPPPGIRFKSTEEASHGH
jgi:hypothetical protein